MDRATLALICLGVALTFALSFSGTVAAGTSDDLSIGEPSLSEANATDITPDESPLEFANDSRNNTISTLLEVGSASESGQNGSEVLEEFWTLASENDESLNATDELRILDPTEGDEELNTTTDIGELNSTERELHVFNTAEGVVVVLSKASDNITRADLTVADNGTVFLTGDNPSEVSTPSVRNESTNAIHNRSVEIPDGSSADKNEVDPRNLSLDTLPVYEELLISQPIHAVSMSSENPFDRVVTGLDTGSTETSIGTTADPIEDTIDSLDDENGDDGADSDAATATSSEPTESDDSTTNESDSTTETPAEHNTTADEDASIAVLEAIDFGGAFEVAPPLGTALFVAVARPWIGLFSATATLFVDWASRILVALRYSRRDDSDPLEHETRSDIADVVTAEPGTTLSELAERLQTPLSTVRYHVQVLKRERYIVSRKQRGNRRLYPVGTQSEELTAALQNDATAEIIDTLETQGEATVGEIVDDVGTTYATVSHHLSRLVDEGLVVQEKDGRQKVSRLSADAKTALRSDREQPRPEIGRGPAAAD